MLSPSEPRDGADEEYREQSGFMEPERREVMDEVQTRKRIDLGNGRYAHVDTTGKQRIFHLSEPGCGLTSNVNDAVADVLIALAADLEAARAERICDNANCTGQLSSGRWACPTCIALLRTTLSNRCDEINRQIDLKVEAQTERDTARARAEKLLGAELTLKDLALHLNAKRGDDCIRVIREIQQAGDKYKARAEKAEREMDELRGRLIDAQALAHVATYLPNGQKRT